MGKSIDLPVVTHSMSIFRATKGGIMVGFQSSFHPHYVSPPPHIKGMRNSCAYSIEFVIATVGVLILVCDIDCVFPTVRTCVRLPTKVLLLDLATLIIVKLKRNAICAFSLG